MKIEVKNFGKIKKGQIDLDKKVTVFVGYNNSGKTYMSQLLWGLSAVEISEKTIEYSPLTFDYQPSVVTVTEELAFRFLEMYGSRIEATLLPILFNVAQDYFSKNEVKLKFSGSFLDRFRLISFNYIVLTGYQEYHSFKKARHSLDIYVGKQILSLRKIKELYIELEVEGDYTFLEVKQEYQTTEELVGYVLPKIFHIHVLDNMLSPFFLPANRVFYPSFYKYIYSMAKDEKDFIDSLLRRGNDLETIKGISKNPYTKATNALIESIFQLNNGSFASPYHADLLQELKEIIGGDIIVKSAEGIAPIEFLLKLEDGMELDMYMASSSANQLTTLYLYFKFWAEEKNNYLIIDEPEENLHPENQIKLVNILMKFADRGNKILITTHSPLITDHVNNYANLSYLNEAGTDTANLISDGKMNIANVKDIKHADYGVYFFSGDAIKEYAFDDYGAYFKDFADAEEKVKDMSNVLRENIYAQKHPNG